MKLTDFQKEFILNNFFKDERFAGWKNIGTALLETGKCIVPGHSCIWVGGIGNFIETKEADGLIGCVEYSFDLSNFMNSAWFKEIKTEYQKRLAIKQAEVYEKAKKMVDDIDSEMKEITLLLSVEPIIDLSTCKKGDILISSHGAKLKYIAPTPYMHFAYLDHVVQYIEMPDGSKPTESFGTRTNDGFVFQKNRQPETDHDIVKIIHK